jgi:hypothetical protein
VTEHRLLVAGAPTAVLEGGEGQSLSLHHSSGWSAAVWLRVMPELVTAHRAVSSLTDLENSHDDRTA